MPFIGTTKVIHFVVVTYKQWFFIQFNVILQIRFVII